MQPQHTTNTPTKQCSKCKEFKPATVELFGPRKASKDGLTLWCKECTRAYNLEYREANREKLLAQQREYVQTNKEKIAAYKRQYAEDNKEMLAVKRREYYEANKEEVLAQQAEFRKANPELIRQRKKAEYERHKDKYIERTAKYQKENKDRVNKQARERWARNRDKFNARKQVRRLARRDEYNARSQRYKVANRDKLNEQGRKRYRENADVRARQLVHGHTRRARKAGLPNGFTLVDWQRCLDYFGGCCAACGRPPGLFHTIAQDHWIPLTSPNCLGTIPTNIVPLCNGRGGCNNSKRDKEPNEWLVWKFGKRKGKEIAARVVAYFDDIKS